MTLSGVCKKYKYIPATTDENITMDVDNITKIILSKINSETNNFRFIKTSYDNITEKSYKLGNKHYTYDLFAFDVKNYHEIRFNVDVIQYIIKRDKNKILTCTELTNKPFTDYKIGIPSKTSLSHYQQK